MIGVLCLETIWFDERQNPSTRHLLELLERYLDIPFVYRNMSTYEELDFHLGRWVGRRMYKKDYQFDDLRVLYLGFHGSPGAISVRNDLRQKADDGGVVDLDQIAKSLVHNAQFNRRGTVIHFGSCSVLRAPSRVAKFKKEIGCAGVSGYSKMVDTITSWAFELMYLELLTAKDSWNKNTLRTLQKKLTEKPEFSGLAKALGFQLII